MSKSIFVKYYPQFLLLILAFTFFTRMYRLHIPEKYVFDEVYHAVTAKLMVDGDTRAYEWYNPPPEPNTAVDWLHPPYAKLTQAASMAIFGKNSFGWRFSSVIFGTLIVFVTAQIANELFKNKPLALLSAFLISLDGLLFALSRIAMNDVHVTFFILLSIWQYIRYINSERKDKKILLLSSIAAGFAVGSKWSGLFAVGFFGLAETVYTIKIFFNAQQKTKSTRYLFLKKQLVLLFVSCCVIPATLYLGAYSQMFLLGKDFHHLIEMHKNTWWYQTNLTATHPAQSKPLQWFLNTKPVWFAVNFESQGKRGDIYAIGNPALFWIGDFAFFLSVLVLITQKLRKKIIIKIKQKELFMLSLLVFAYTIVWLPWQLSPRIMFFYHYLPAVPLLSINLAYWLIKLWDNQKFRLISVVIIALIVLCFIVLYPHLTLLPVSNDLKEKIYFFFEFWKQT